MTQAYINRIATAVPPNEVHSAFATFQKGLLVDSRKQGIFDRLAERGQVEQRWSCLTAAPDCLSAWNGKERFYARGDFPATARRMAVYEREAPKLAERAVHNLDLGGDALNVTHLVITSCTGFSAPGIDLELVRRFGLNPSIERTIIGFMGCYAAINGLKLARHFVRSEPRAKVLLVSVELCSLHFQETDDLELSMPSMLFADGCAAALVSAEPAGAILDSFYATVMESAADQMAWHIRDGGFEMVLSSKIPVSVGTALKDAAPRILGGDSPNDFDLWAVHPGGRAVLDAVEHTLGLPADALSASREVLRAYGNMSSATVLFVLKALMAGATAGQRGCAMSFGPGLTAETMLFRMAA